MRPLLVRYFTYSLRANHGRLSSTALTVLLAVVVLVIPADYVQPFTGPDGVARELTASIIIVGVLGAYWAILGIYLVIAGLSLKWAPSVPQKVEAA